MVDFHGQIPGRFRRGGLRTGRTRVNPLSEKRRTAASQQSDIAVRNGNYLLGTGRLNAEFFFDEVDFFVGELQTFVIVGG